MSLRCWLFWENAGQRDDAAARDVDGHTPLIAGALLEEAVGPQLLLDHAFRRTRIETGDGGRRRTRLRDDRLHLALCPRGRPRPCAPPRGVPPPRSRASWPPLPRASPRRRRRCPGAADRRSAPGGRLVPGAADRRAEPVEPLPPSSCLRGSTAGPTAMPRTAMTATAPPIMAPRPKRRGLASAGMVVCAGEGLTAPGADGRSDRRRRRGRIMARDPRLRQEDHGSFRRAPPGVARAGARPRPASAPG